jgi:hypothetical protein
MKVKVHEKLRVCEALQENQNGMGVVLNFLPDGFKCVALERNTNFGSGFFVSSVARLIIYEDKTEIGGSFGKQGGKVIWEFLKEKEKNSNKSDE